MSNLIFSIEECSALSLNSQTSFGGRDFDPTKKEFLLFGRIVRNVSSEEAKKPGLVLIANIPGMSIGQALWRLSNSFKEDFERIEAITIEKYDKDKLGQEGAVKVAFLKKY